MSLPSDECLVDSFLSEGIPLTMESAENWQELVNWQFDAIKDLGIKPEHKIIDIGCGFLRAGMNLVPYLNDHHYFGVDAFKPYLNIGKKLLSEIGVSNSFDVRFDTGFNLDQFGQTFDYAMSIAVVTHLSKKQIETLFKQLKKVMKPGGLFLMTYIPIKDCPPRGFYFHGFYDYPMSSSPFCNREYLQELASSLGIEWVTGLLPEESPSQKVGVFRF